jgi:hypothetical protein
MARKVIGVTFLIAFLLGCEAEGVAQKLHPKLKNKEVVLKSLLIIPPRVNITKDTAKGGEGMLKESEAIEKATRKLAIDTLKSKGFTVIDGDAPADSANTNEEARYSLADLQGKYDQLYPQVQSKMKDIEKGRFTLGEDVSKIRPPSPVDALIFVRGSGNVQTFGKRVVGALMGRGTVSTILISYGVIDAKTGEFLYFDKRELIGVTLGKLERPEAAFKKVTEQAFRKVPAPAQASATNAK